MIRYNDAQFNLYSYTSDLNIISNEEIYCNGEELCHNSYNHLMKLANTKYVCFYPYLNNLNCFRYAYRSEYIYKGYFVSFGITHSHKFIGIIEETNHTLQYFYDTIFTQCLHHSEYINMAAFCIAPLIN